MNYYESPARGDDHSTLPKPQEVSGEVSLHTSGNDFGWAVVLTRVLVALAVVFCSAVAGIYYEAQMERGGTPGSTLRHVVRMVTAQE